VLERNRVLVDALYLAHAFDGELHATGDLLHRWLATELLEQLALHAHDLVDGLDHVDGDANGATLVGQGAGDGWRSTTSHTSRI